MTTDYPDRDERGRRASDEIIEALRKLERHYGSYAVAKMIGVSHHTVTRCLAGAPLYHRPLTAIHRYLRDGGHLR